MSMKIWLGLVYSLIRKVISTDTYYLAREIQNGHFHIPVFLGSRP